MNIALAKTETGRAVSNVFTAARERLPGAGKVAELRRQAFDAFERAGLPHRRIEDWKYTDLRADKCRKPVCVPRTPCHLRADGRGPA